MDGNVIKKSLFIILLTLFLLLILGCNNSRIPLKEINNFEKKASSMNHSVTISIKGETSCPIELQIFRNKNFHLKCYFNGKIDTILRDDWYEEEISFQVFPIKCIKEGTFAEIKFHD